MKTENILKISGSDFVSQIWQLFNYTCLNILKNLIFDFWHFWEMSNRANDKNIIRKVKYGISKFISNFFFFLIFSSPTKKHFWWHRNQMNTMTIDNETSWLNKTTSNIVHFTVLPKLHIDCKLDLVLRESTFSLHSNNFSSTFHKILSHFFISLSMLQFSSNEKRLMSCLSLLFNLLLLVPWFSSFYRHHTNTQNSQLSDPELLQHHPMNMTNIYLGNPQLVIWQKKNQLLFAHPLLTI